MPSATPISTDYLILRKTPYSDTSLVVAGVSPEHGQLHFLVRGGRRVSKRQFPVADVFRVVSVQYREGRGELYSWRSAELVTDFMGVARNVKAFQTAGWLARFALANVPPAMAVPRFYGAMLTALQRLADPEQAGDPLGRQAALVGACIVYLDENGLLPERPDNPRAAERRRALLDMGAGAAAPPPLDPDVWSRVQARAFALLDDAGCVLPEGAA